MKIKAAPKKPPHPWGGKKGKRMDIKKKLRELQTEFEKNNAWNSTEESIQSLYTLDLLTELGWKKGNYHINEGPEVKTGKRPDILLLNDAGNTLLVIESKDASKKTMLDGKYASKTFVEQLHGYCDAEGIYWGILTNFVEWRVYSIYQDRLYKERKYAFHELLWSNAVKSDYIDLFSEQGIQFLERLSKSSLVSLKGKWDSDPVYYPQQDEIKDKFFQDLKNWRSILRSFLADKYSSKYELDVIDLFTQKILDRLIFIDYCRDNEILSQDYLLAVLQSQGGIYTDLLKVFAKLDDKFNLELFAPSECDNLEIDDDVLIPIISELSKTDFTKLSVHVIGEVYENYLGELLKYGKHGVKTDDKKQLKKKKSQGIFYTPDYIVDFIVKNTVGEILKKCKTVDDIRQIKVLDPACGSGSFLIRVFDEFLKHYERIQPSGLFQFETRKRILQENIYGVDLDERAVEIAKLNLLVKALENTAHLSLSGRKLLPNLKLNIRCGNSLVSGESLTDDINNLFPPDQSKDKNDLLKLRSSFHASVDDAKQRDIFENICIREEQINIKLNEHLAPLFKRLEDIKPFNYSIAFPEILERGGFDCIVGNPPYVTLSLGKGQDFVSKQEIDYYNSIFQVCEYKGNTYSIFIEKALRLCRPGGLCSLIVPNTLLLNNTFKKARKYILEQCSIKSLINFKYRVFETAETGGNLVFVFNKSNKPSKIMIAEIDTIDAFHNLQWSQIDQSEYSQDSTSRFILDISNLKLLKKLQFNSLPFSSIVESYQGIITGDNTKYLADKKINSKYCKILAGRDINKYELNYANKYVLYDKDLLWSNTDDRFFKAKEKIISRQTADGLIATYDDNQYYTLDSTHVHISRTDKYPIKYVLALFNSSLLNYVYKCNVQETGRVFAQVKVVNLQNLPIKKLTTENDNTLCSKIIANVNKLIAFNSNKSSKAKNSIKIKAILNDIDKLIYTLYGLSDKEIKSIETYLLEDR